MEDRAREIARKYARRVVNKTNACTGFGVELDENKHPVFVTYVEKRRDSHRWLEKLRLDNIPVRVKERPKMTAFAADRTIKHRPAPGGVSIGHEDITAGTLGMLVEKNGTTYILSNNHVLADSNGGTPGDDIVQPGPYDGGESPDDKIGELSEFIPIIFNDDRNPNYVDGALCEPTNENLVENRLLELVEVAPPYWGEAWIGQKVAKSGRTTGVTRGEVIGFWSGWVNYGGGYFAWFDDQIIVHSGDEENPFAAGGDSGSIVITDPFRDIAFVPEENAILVKVRGEGPTLEKDICITCCGFEGPPGGPVPCPFCEDAGKETPNYLRVTIEGITPCPECHNFSEGSFEVENFTLEGYRLAQNAKACIGLLFAGGSEGYTVLNRMSKVVEELELDMEEAPKEKQPLDMILRIYSASPALCTWKNWNVLYKYFADFQGYFGTCRVYSESNCEGDYVEKNLDLIDFGVNMEVEGQASMGGWVSSSEFAMPYGLLFFTSVIYSDCAGVPGGANSLECYPPQHLDFEGGSATIVPAVVYEGDPEILPLSSVSLDKPKLILDKAEKEPPVFTGWQIAKCRRCKHIQKEGTWCGYWDIPIPEPEVTAKEKQTIIKRLQQGPKGPPTEEAMRAEYDLAAGGMRRAGREAVSWDVYLEHRKICIECSGGYRCPHYCCGIQAQLAKPQWECREKKY